MKLLFVFFIIFVNHSSRTKRLFTKFLQKFRKIYPTVAEYTYRSQIFENNLMLIEKINKASYPSSQNNDEDALVEGYNENFNNKFDLKFALNDNADLTDTEFESQYLMKRNPLYKENPGEVGISSMPNQYYSQNTQYINKSQTLPINTNHNPFQRQPSFSFQSPMMQIPQNIKRDNQLLNTFNFPQLPPSQSLSFNVKEVDHSLHLKDYKIKNQRGCGSCWAASAISMIEIAHYLIHNQYVYLSYQELLNCCRTPSEGCNGGSAREALQYIQTNGIFYDSSMPYEAQQMSCESTPRSTSLNTHLRNVKEKLFRRVSEGDRVLVSSENFSTNRKRLLPVISNVKNFINNLNFPNYNSQLGIDVPNRYYGIKKINFLGAGVEAIINALKKNPVVISINNSKMFRFYSSGVFETMDCKTGITDHNFVAVGYSLSAQKPYIKVLNSWGSNWGMKGYGLVGLYLLSSKIISVCGLDTDPSNYQVEI